MDDRTRQLASALDGRYAFEREIGGGASATVHLALDRKHDRRVALKVLDPVLASAVGAPRFLREIEIVARLRHPNILPLYDSGHEHGCLYFVMPFVQGGSLRSLLERDGPMPVEEARRITRETLDALAYAHSERVLHRDIKPENILLDSGHAVVADFGVARAVGAAGLDRLTATGGTPGTPLYMSPEQAGGGGRVDERTDIYSLGCVLYEMLVGEPPYGGATAQAMIARRMFEPVPGMRVVRDSIPESLEAATRKALARAAVDRFQTASEMSEGLARTTQPTGSARERAAAGGAQPALGAVRPSESARDPGKRGHGTGLLRPGVLASVTVGLIAGALLLSLIGFLNVTFLDYWLRVPTSLTPSRTDFAVVGAKAVFPFAIYALLAFLAFEVARPVVRAAGALLRRAPRLGESLGGLPDHASRQWRQFWEPLHARSVAEVFLVVAIVVGATLLAVYWRLLSNMWSPDGPQADLLSCASRAVHRSYQVNSALTIAVLGVGWYRVFGYLRGRGVRAREVALPRWGAAMWIVLLFVFTAAPWSILWGSRERAWMDGERAYIVAEDAQGMLIYEPHAERTAHHPRSEPSGISRLGVSGLMYEEADAFESGERDCEAILDSLDTEDPS